MVVEPFKIEGFWLVFKSFCHYNQLQKHHLEKCGGGGGGRMEVPILARCLTECLARSEDEFETMDKIQNSLLINRVNQSEIFQFFFQSLSRRCVSETQIRLRVSSHEVVFSVFFSRCCEFGCS